MEPSKQPDEVTLRDAAYQMVKRRKAPIRKQEIASNLKEWFGADKVLANTAIHALIRAKRLHVLGDGRLWWSSAPPQPKQDEGGSDVRHRIETSPYEALKEQCSWLLTACEGDEPLERALMGLIHSAKSTVIVPRVVAALVEGDPQQAVKTSRGDDAAFVAESMVRAVHACGDLLGQVVSRVVCRSDLGSNKVNLPKTIEAIRKRVNKVEVGGDEREWLGQLAGDLQGLQESSDYQYVSDFSNTAKHRDYIERELVTTEEHCIINFMGFEKDGRRYEARSFGQVLETCLLIIDMCLAILRRLVLHEDTKRLKASGGTVVSNYYQVTASSTWRPSSD